MKPILSMRFVVRSRALVILSRIIPPLWRFGGRPVTWRPGRGRVSRAAPGPDGRIAALDGPAVARAHRRQGGPRGFSPGPYQATLVLVALAVARGPRARTGVARGAVVVLGAGLARGAS